MSDRWVVAIAVAVWVSAVVVRGMPVGLGIAVVAVALAIRRPWLLLCGCVLVAGRLDPPPQPAEAVSVAERQFAGPVVLRTDPERVGAATVADVSWAGGRGRAWAFAGTGAALARHLAGQRLDVEGRLRIGDDATRLSVEVIHSVDEGSTVARAANLVRSALVRGARPLPADQRTLLTGLVLGDDRGQSDLVADDFRGSGLSHLLAVSGQNVAFVLVVVRPVLRRTPLGVRWALTVAVLLFFAVLTRFEPSVVRATAMALVAVTGRELGFRSSPIRLLAAAVALVVMVVPGIVVELAFQLSVAAAGGIVVAAGWLADRFRGPRPVREAAAVTIAAQLAVAPLLITTFGPIPVASIPANVLAAPAAAGVMMWGLTAGPVAGLFGGSVATVLHLPTRLLLSYLQAVAGVGASSGLGSLGSAELVLGAAALAVAAGARRAIVRRSAVIAMLILVAVVAMRPASGPVLHMRDGSWLHRTDDEVVLVITAAEGPAEILASLRRWEIRSVDLVVVEDGSTAAAEQLRAVRARARVGSVWGPSGHRLQGVTAIDEGASAAVGRLTVMVHSSEPELVVVVTPMS